MNRRIALIDSDCVSCGSCVKICPLQAIQIYKGMIAQVNTDKCVGCGKCARNCPADVITIAQREAAL